MIFCEGEEVLTGQYCIVRGERQILFTTEIKNLWYMNKMAPTLGL